MIEERYQLRIVLHLYNALLVNEDIFPDEDIHIPFLESLLRGFRKNKVLWGGPLPPTKGKLAERFQLGMEQCPDPNEFSTSYRRIIDLDFHDVVDRYHWEEISKQKRGEDY